MNFGYEGKEDKEIIKRYSKDSDKIVINFLDDSQYEIPYTYHNEEKLLDDMIEQAIERNQKATNQQSEMKKKAIKAVFWYTVFAMGNGGVYYLNNNFNNSSTFWKYYSIIFGSIASVFAIISGSGYFMYKAQQDELTKYAIYLEIKDKINDVNPNIFYKVVKRELNINTLDSFKLSELKQLKENVLKCEQFSEYSTTNPTLTKKIGK